MGLCAEQPGWIELKLLNFYHFYLLRLTGGELFEEISKQEFILEKDACHYMRQVLDAVGHLHERNIVHLDLKVTCC